MTETPTITPNKTVRFKDKVRVRRVPTRASMSQELKSELWVSKEDILRQAQGCKRSFSFLKLGLKLSEEVIEDISKLYLDGLESSQEKSKRHARMFRAMQSVLDEQTRLEKVYASTKSDPLQIEAQIASQYSKYAAESAHLALERGRNQAKAQGDCDDMMDTSDNERVRGTRPSIFDRLKNSTTRRSPQPQPRRSPLPRVERQHR